MVHYITAITAFCFASALAAQLTPLEDTVSLDIVPRQDYSGGAGGTIVQIVKVSDNNASIKYWPERIDAPVGSIVQFQFYPKNHTVTESSFAEPCKPLAANLTSETRPGQRSGFIPVSIDPQFRPVYNILINDTKPIWIYCGQATHCQNGMAMVINQNASDTVKTIENYKKNAKALLDAAGSSSMMSASSATGFASGTMSYPATTNAASSTGASGPVISTASTTTAGPSTFSGAAVRPRIGSLAGVAGFVLAGIALPL